MKKRSRKAQLIRKHEFRYYNSLVINRRGQKVKFRHPAYIFLEKGNLFIFVTITHSKTVPNKIVVELRKNPNPSDKRIAYYVADIKEDTKDKFRKRLLNWKIDKFDDEEIQKLYKKR